MSDPTLALEIVTYPHPALRVKAKPLRRVDAQLRSTVREMFQLMYQARGVGLAATQVALPLQLFIVNAAGAADQGEELVFINPVIDSPRGSDEDDEGCLSIPGIYGYVRRPAQVHVRAYDLEGQLVDHVVTGPLARIIQHEYDHLQGILFIDRLKAEDRRGIHEELEQLAASFESQQQRGEMPDERAIMTSLMEIESRYC